MQDVLQNELVDPKGVFANTLASGLETELRAQIQENVEKMVWDGIPSRLWEVCDGFWI